MTDHATFVPDEHMRRKRDAYWTDLVGGVTGRYKTAQVQRLLEGRTLPDGSSVIDVGAGTSDLSKMVAEYGGVAKIVCLDYDDAIVQEMRAAEEDPRVEWRTGDAGDLEAYGSDVGAVGFFDILHEVYSFVGRSPETGAVDHATGRAAVEDILRAAATALAPGGVILITDDVLPEEGDTAVRVRTRTEEIATLIQRVEREYPSRPLEIAWEDDGRTFTIPARTFITLLTHYNKPKNGDEARWAVEQMEVHEYMKVSEYESFFGALGLTVSTDVGTPPEAYAEWAGDFEVLGGLDDFPAKRVAVLAAK
ncbi:MAG TPA: methyltransferase domain-containing protein [Baekduia sp.]|nr:methyltransferase domain-containing protein [Baekduia sp.]